MRKGVLKADAELCATSLTGYSGGGQKMIADYETAQTPLHLGGRQYALGQKHKHLPEMLKVCGLAAAPAFLPIVVPHYSGMEVSIPLFRSQLADASVTADDLKRLYASYYTQGLVRFAEAPDEGGFLSSAALSGKDVLEVSVYGDGGRQGAVGLGIRASAAPSARPGARGRCRA